LFYDSTTLNVFSDTKALVKKTLACYHAPLPASEKSRVIVLAENKLVRVVAATSAASHSVDVNFDEVFIIHPTGAADDLLQKAMRGARRAGRTCHVTLIVDPKIFRRFITECRYQLRGRNGI